MKQWIQKRKGILLLCAVFLLLISVFSSVVFSESSEALHISSQLNVIENELGDEGKVRVLVVLEDDSQTVSSDALLRSTAIEQKQEQFFEELRHDAQLGSLTVKGLESKDTKVSESDARFSGVSIATISQDKISGDGTGSVDDSVRLEVHHEFETLNAVSVTVHDQDVLDAIIESSEVSAIYYDYPVSVTLDSSVSQINANDLWSEQLNGLALTGQGESVCVIDTGIDYTHNAFGSCNPVRYSVTGTVETLSTPVESDHDYANLEDITYTITQEGYDTIAVHFDQIGLEAPSSAGDALDRIYVLDGNNDTIAIYKGNHSDIWSPHVTGDTISIRLVSDNFVTDYGFLIDQVVNGTTNTTMDWSSCPVVAGGYDVYNSDPDPFDDNIGIYHGTHVSGIVASRNETYTGVAPGASIVSVKALNSAGGGYSSDVAAAVEWCHSNANELNISVITMSLGCTGSSCTHYQSACDSDLTAFAIANAATGGIATVIASGNSEWTDGIANPSCVSSAIPVGSVGSSDTMSSFSNRGDLLELVAPGSSITSSTLSNTWSSYSGTSMATPHVAGAIALIQQYWQAAYGSRLSPSAIEARLASTGILVEDSASGNNYSRIDVLAAISPTLTLSNSSVQNDSFVANGTALFNVSSDLELSSVDLLLTLPNASTNQISLTQENATVYSTSIDLQESGAYSYYFMSNSSVLEFEHDVSQFSVIVVGSGQGGGGNSSAPEFASQSYFPSLVYGNSSVTFTANITDDTGIDNSSVLLELEHSSLAVNYSLTAVSKEIFEVTVSNSSVFVPGQDITFSFYVTDLSSNFVQSNSSSFTVLNNNLSFVNITEPTSASIQELNESVLFTAQAIDPDAQELTYSWDFADGSSLVNVSANSSASLYHSFTQEGTFTIQVTVYDMNSSLNDSLVVIVNDSLAPTISSISYSSSVDLASASQQEVTVLAQDASGLSNISLYYLDELIASSSLAEANLTAVSFGNFSSTASGLSFVIEVIDNSIGYNSQNVTYTFDVIDSTTSSSSSESTTTESSSSAPSGGGGGGGGGGGSGSPAASISNSARTSVSSSDSVAFSTQNIVGSLQESSEPSAQLGSNDAQDATENEGESTQGFLSRVFTWISSLFTSSSGPTGLGASVESDLSGDSTAQQGVSNGLTAAVVTDFVNSLEFDERSVSIAVLLVFIVVLFGLYVAFKPEEE